MKIINKASIALVFTAALVVGCSDDFKNEFNEAYEKSFRTSFRESFVSSCAPSVENEKVKAICACIADDLLNNMTVDQLESIDRVKKRMDDISLPKCQQSTSLDP